MRDQKRPTTEDLLKSSKRLFDAGVGGIDPATAARLRAARRRALAVTPAPWLASPQLWLPVAAAAALIAVLVLPRQETGAPPDQRGFTDVATADLEILLADAELEMLADLEFYEWLELQEGESTDTEIEDGVG